MPRPGAERPRHRHDVLVAIWRPEHAEALVLRGVRLARRRGAHCYVLGLSQPGQAPVVLPEQAAEAAIAAGATMLERDSRDASAAIISAVQETGVRHIVLPAPSAGLFERWRGTLVERLASQLPGVHLHVQAASTATPAAPEPVPGAAVPAERRRGAVRVYLGYARGCGTTTAMLEEAFRRQSRGTDVVIAAVSCASASRSRPSWKTWRCSATAARSIPMPCSRASRRSSASTS